MTARLAYSPAADTPNSPNVVNKFGLENFFSLPGAWQQKLLLACGGTGVETAMDLVLALAPPPKMPPLASVASRIVQASPARRGRTTSRQNEILAAAADQEMAFWHAREAWVDAAQHELTAVLIREAVTGLDALPQHHLHLLTVDDDGLLDEADRIVKVTDARHERLVSKGLVGVHPRERDRFSVRRRLRRSVGRTAAHAAGILRLIGGASGKAYADDWSVGRWRQVKAAGKAFLQNHIAISDDATLRFINQFSSIDFATLAM